MSECKYCDFSQGYGEDFLPITRLLTVYMTNQPKPSLSVSSDYKDNVLAMNFKINYCPMCGRKLTGED